MTKTIWIIVAVLALAALLYYFCWEPADAAPIGEGAGGGSGGGGGYPLGDMPASTTTVTHVAAPAMNSNPGLSTTLGGTGSTAPQLNGPGVSGGPTLNAPGIGSLTKPRGVR